MVTMLVKLRARMVSSAIVLGLLAACAVSPAPPATSGGGSSTPALTFASSGRADFDTWRNDFAARAIAGGRDRDVVYSVLAGLEPLEIYLPSDPVVRGQTGIDSQAEFAKPIWDYVSTAVSDRRQRNGRAKAAENRSTFDQIEARFGVDREVITAIWGMETSYGGFKLTFDGPETLANMAVEGRRRRLGESELIALMKIIERGEARRDQLAAGWAGAMGQVQFMPTTFLAHAVDWSGDGVKDIWTSEPDALASAANYLSASGYRPGEPWGLEVAVPQGFDFSIADGRDRRMGTWQQLGLTPINGGAFDTGGAEFARLWLPAGAQGPKYLLFENFRVFLAYNPASAYAFSVGLLSDAIAGRPGPQTPWPTNIQPLSVAQVKELQASLNKQGFDAGPVDGIAGSGTRRALQRWQQSRGIPADGYPTLEMLTYVRGAERS